MQVKINEVTRRLNYIEQLNLDCDVVLTNVEQNFGIDNTKDAVNKLCELLEVTKGANKITFCSRMKPRNKNRIAPIVVRFADHSTKQAFVKQARKKQLFNDQLGNHSHRRIFVNHRLTSSYQQIDRITKEIKAKSGCAAWYDKARFFLQDPAELTPIEVQSIDDIPQEFFQCKTNTILSY